MRGKKMSQAMAFIVLSGPFAIFAFVWHFFFGGGQLHPLTDQHTLVVLAKVRDEGFKITV